MVRTFASGRRLARDGVVLKGNTMAKITRRTVTTKPPATTGVTKLPARVSVPAVAAPAIPTGWLVWGGMAYAKLPNSRAFGSGATTIPAISVLGVGLVPNRADADRAYALWKRSAMLLGGSLNGFVTSDPSGIQGYTTGPSGFPVVNLPVAPARIDSPPLAAPQGRWFIWNGNSYVPEVAALSRGAAGVIPWGGVVTWPQRGDAEAFQSQHNWPGFITQDWSGTRDNPPSPA